MSFLWFIDTRSYSTLSLRVTSFENSKDISGLDDPDHSTEFVDGYPMWGRERSPPPPKDETRQVRVYILYK